MPIRLRVLTVTDLHRCAALYQELHAVVAHHRPHVVAFVGDLLHGFDDNQGRLTVEQCAQSIAALPCKEVVFVRGNHEDHFWAPFAQAWARLRRRMHALHGEGYAYEALTMVGFPCFLGMEEAVAGPRGPLPMDPEEWLPPVLRSWGPAARTLWLMHEPPRGTLLSEPDTPLAGNQEWNQAIEKHRPWVTISGHDHYSPIQNQCWSVQIGDTWCINAGQTNFGPLHYCVIESEYQWSRPSLPRFMTVTAYPWNEMIEIEPPPPSR